jgi:peptide/nickel transport system substrate-binding protein
VEWEREKELILLKNYTYKIRQPFLHRIVFRFPKPGVNLLRELRRARIELVSDISTKNASKLSSHPAYRVEHKAGQRICQIYLNAEQYPFDRAGVRKAVLLGIDRQDIVAKVFNGFATHADSCIPPWHPYHDPNEDIYLFDPNQALKILAGEGFTSEFPVSFSLMYTDDDPFKAIAELIVVQLARVGIQVHLVPLAKKDLFDYVYGRDGRDRALFQAALEDWEDWRGGGGIEQFTWRLYHPSSPENKLGHLTYPWEEALAMATRACEPGTRKNLFMRSVSQIDQSLITIYLCYPHRIWAARKWVNGKLCNSLGHLFLDRIWVR